MASMKHYIVIGNRKYEYVLEPARTRTTLICEGAGISQKYSNSEIPNILAALPQIIAHINEQRASEVQSESLRFRVTSSEKEQIALAAYDAGFTSMSAYLRAKVLDT